MLSNIGARHQGTKAHHVSSPHIVLDSSYCCLTTVCLEYNINHYLEKMAPVNLLTRLKHLYAKPRGMFGLINIFKPI